MGYNRKELDVTFESKQRIYIFKPERFAAVQWFKPEDHPKTTPFDGSFLRGVTHCTACGTTNEQHGWLVITSRDDDGSKSIYKRSVCPGDWIVDGKNRPAVWKDIDFQQHFLRSRKGIVDKGAKVGYPIR